MSPLAGRGGGDREQPFEQGAVFEDGLDVVLVQRGGGAHVVGDALGVAECQPSVGSEPGCGAGEFKDDEGSGGLGFDNGCGRVAWQRAGAEAPRGLRWRRDTRALVAVRLRRRGVGRSVRCFLRSRGRCRDKGDRTDKTLVRLPLGRTSLSL